MNKIKLILTVSVLFVFSNATAKFAYKKGVLVPTCTSEADCERLIPTGKTNSEEIFEKKHYYQLVNKSLLDYINIKWINTFPSKWPKGVEVTYKTLDGPVTVDLYVLQFFLKRMMSDRSVKISVAEISHEKNFCLSENQLNKRTGKKMNCGPSGIFDPKNQACEVPLAFTFAQEKSKPVVNICHRFYFEGFNPLYQAYILTHEYIHKLGIRDEAEVERLMRVIVPEINLKTLKKYK